MTEQTITARQQIESLKQQLLEAFVARDKAREDEKAADEKIRAIRNVLAGVPVWQQLAAEMAPADPPPTKDA